MSQVNEFVSASQKLRLTVYDLILAEAAVHPELADVRFGTILAMAKGVCDRLATELETDWRQTAGDSAFGGKAFGAALKRAADQAKGPCVHKWMFVPGSDGGDQQCMWCNQTRVTPQEERK